MKESPVAGVEIPHVGYETLSTNLNAVKHLVGRDFGWECLGAESGY